MADAKAEVKAKADLKALMAANPGLTWPQLYALLAAILAAFGIALPPLPSATEADVDAVLTGKNPAVAGKAINWGNLWQILQTIIAILGPILGGLGGGGSPAPTP